MTPSGSGDLERMWQQQADLNRLFRPDGPPTEFAERTALTKEIVLHLISECDELLRKSGSWQPHRNIRHRRVMENRPAIAYELTDIHKYLISLYQIWGFTPDDMREYWAKKDMIVRQRHSEEFVKSLDQPSVLIDLDGVLADYIEGFLTFLRGHGIPDYILDGLRNKGWIDKATFANWISEDKYDELRHQFRISGGFSRLPMLPGARSMVDWLHEQNYYVIILTSRPIHLYPNIYADTMLWLNDHELRYDFIWWAQDKGNMIEDLNILPHIRFAIDDDEKFVQQFARLGIRTFWLTPRTFETLVPNVETAKNLTEVLTLLNM